MFTQNRIALSDIVEENPDLQADLEIIRDFSFCYVSKIPIDLPYRLVSVSDASHLGELSQVDGIAGVLTTADLLSQIPEHLGVAVCPSPYIRAMDVHEHLIKIPNLQWENFDSKIDPTAQIHPNAVVADKNVKIGPNCQIGPNAVICERVIMGENCSVGPGAIIGCDAYDLRAGSNPVALLKQSGGVRIGNNVTILASTTIVRASFGGFTTIEDEASFDNLVHIAHDCVIGKRVKVAACAELSGRVTVGDNSFLGPNITVSNGVTIGQNSTITLGSVVVRDVDENSRVTGNFALPHAKWLRFIKSIR